MKTKISFFKNLWQRRVPQILGIYLGASWAIIEFVSSLLVDRYLLSSHLITLCIIILFTLIPSVLLLAYFHGKSGKDEWVKYEKIGIPVNLLISAFLIYFLLYNKYSGSIFFSIILIVLSILLFILFQKRYFESTTSSVTVLDEEGQTIQREIPKSEFRKKITIFFFNNESEDENNNWLQYAIKYMLEIDLEQDLYIRTSFGSDIYNRMKKAGFSNYINIPLSLKKQLSSELHQQYFLTGIFKKKNDTFEIDTNLYDTKRFKLLKNRKFSGNQIFSLIDEIALQIKKDMNVPSKRLEEFNSMPVAEMMTNNLSAMKSYTSGINSINFYNDYQKAVEKIEQAIKEDPSFAYAYLQLIDFYLNTMNINQDEKMKQIFSSLMKNLYKFPEKDKYVIKYAYYLIQVDFDKAIAVLNMWIKFYPDDIRPHFILVRNHLTSQNRYKDIISEYKKILKIDPQQYGFIQSIASVYDREGKIKKAVKYYEKYTDIFPDNANSYLQIGNLYKRVGNYEEAKSYYEKTLVIEPYNINAVVSLSTIKQNFGKLAEANKDYENILLKCKTPADKMRVYSAMASLFELKGMLKETLKYRILEISEGEKSVRPLQLITNQKRHLIALYVQMGKKESAFQIVEDLKKLPSPINEFYLWAFMDLYSEIQDAENLEKTINKIKKSSLDKVVGGYVKYFIIIGEGNIFEFKGEYKKAVNKYEKIAEFPQFALQVKIPLGRCYRLIRKFNKSGKILKDYLKIFPIAPECNYELALTYKEKGKTKEAIKLLKSSLETWKDADPEYKPAQKAREKMKEWEAES